MWYFTPFPITSIYSPPRNVLFLEVLRPSKISDLSYTYPVLQILVFLFIPQNMHLLKRCFYGSFYSFSTPSLAAHHCWISKSTQASAYCGKAAASARGVREPLMRVRPPLFSRTASAEIPFSQPLNYILLHSLSWSLILWFPKQPCPMPSWWGSSRSLSFLTVVGFMMVFVHKLSACCPLVLAVPLPLKP